MLRLAFAALLCAAPANEEPIHLYTGEERLIGFPKIQRIAVSNGCYDIKTVGNDQVLLIGANAGCKSTVLLWDSSDARHLWRLEIDDPPRGERFSLLHPGDVATLPLAGVTSAASSDPKAVRAEPTDAGYVITARALGGADVRVEAAGLRFVHRVRVRSRPPPAPR